MTIRDLTPSIVWNNFYDITRIPRPSKHEEKIRAYLLDWAKERGIEAFADDTGNVIMRIPATPGYENRKGVILQGHMDMVPQKNSDVKHDFLTDPIETKVEGDWIKACGTTLGADDGLGVAIALSLAEDKSVKHGPLEILITYDEETGMTGASLLKSGVLKGDILINVDSETEGELYVGCAGGVDASAEGSYVEMPVLGGWKAYKFAVKGCQGGHSGMDIVLYRANANKVAARVLYEVLKTTELRIVELEGGTLRNAIPRECFATVLVKDEHSAEAAIAEAAEKVREEYKETDPDMEITFTPVENVRKDLVNIPGIGLKLEREDSGVALAASVADSRRIIEAILACPDGVERMSAAVSGLCETSTNMAMVGAKDGKWFVKSLLRSSVDSAKFALAHKMEATFALAGATTTFDGAYSGWKPNPDSEILHIMEKVYKKRFKEEPKVMAIHAGLECGILSGAYPHWDMVSCGPTLKSPHSPDERAYIPSVQKVWDFLRDVLAEIPECKKD